METKSEADVEQRIARARAEERWVCAEFVAAEGRRQAANGGRDAALVLERLVKVIRDGEVTADAGAQAVADERERCAGLVETWHRYAHRLAGDLLPAMAAEIRGGRHAAVPPLSPPALSLEVHVDEMNFETTDKPNPLTGRMPEPKDAGPIVTTLVVKTVAPVPPGFVRALQERAYIARLVVGEDPAPYVPCVAAVKPPAPRSAIDVHALLGTVPAKPARPTLETIVRILAARALPYVSAEDRPVLERFIG
jgi:hypothetical protein